MPELTSQLPLRQRRDRPVRARACGLVVALFAFGAGLAAAPAAFAGEVVLWACHGPAGQGLGLLPFSSVASGDGVTSAAVGCAGSVAPSSVDGLSASFSRPDPAGGSVASWQLTVPTGVTLDDVSVRRATTGFGGAQQPTDLQAYSLWTPTSVLDFSSLTDASDVALTGPLSAAATGPQVQIGVSCGDYAAHRCDAPAGGGTVGVSFSSIALTVTDASVPEGAVGGVQSVAAGELNLSVSGSDSGLGLESLSASLDGQTVASSALGGATCANLSAGPGIDLPLNAACPAQVVGVPLTVDLSTVTDGRHLLTVALTDAAGTTATLVNQEIDVINHPAGSTPSVTIKVGTVGDGSTGSGASSTATQNVCEDAALTVRLADRPLRLSHGRLVLKRKKRYHFGGRLTCVTNGHRVGASRNTVVDLSFKVHRHTLDHFGTATDANGRISVDVACASTRTIVFTYTSPTGTVTQASLHVLVRRR